MLPNLSTSLFEVHDKRCCLQQKVSRRRLHETLLYSKSPRGIFELVDIGGPSAKPFCCG